MERAAHTRPFQYDKSLVFSLVEANAVEKVRPCPCWHVDEVPIRLDVTLVPLWWTLPQAALLKHQRRLLLERERIDQVRRVFVRGEEWLYKRVGGVKWVQAGPQTRWHGKDCRQYSWLLVQLWWTGI